jgi:hypothetical protein
MKPPNYEILCDDLSNDRLLQQTATYKEFIKSTSVLREKTVAYCEAQVGYYEAQFRSSVLQRKMYDEIVSFLNRELSGAIALKLIMPTENDGCDDGEDGEDKKCIDDWIRYNKIQLKVFNETVERDTKNMEKAREELARLHATFSQTELLRYRVSSRKPPPKSDNEDSRKKPPKSEDGGNRKRPVVDHSGPTEPQPNSDDDSNKKPRFVDYNRPADFAEISDTHRVGRRLRIRNGRPVLYNDDY